jgi:hydrogenase maturation protease
VLKKIAVIGLGNTLRRDDGIGISVLESLLNSHKIDGIDYLNFGIAGFDLLNKIRDYDETLLIDGINASLSAGELRIFEIGDIKHELKPPASSSHELGLKDMFELYKKLDIKTKVYVAGIQVADVSFGEGLTEPLNKRQKEIVKEISLFIYNALGKA